MTIEFKEFQKIPRYNREVFLTEKIDGTNACVVVTEEGLIYAQSRNRLISLTEDNYGFARWVAVNAKELLTLGPGYHYGEWWGGGIQRGYGLDHKRFSLFNVSRWGEIRPQCCHVVPVLARGLLRDNIVELALTRLEKEGSVAAPGFMKPEGVIIYHCAANQYFKATLEKDHERKGVQ